jgi:formylglycine-generating enzyme required for sulfatase activity
LQLILQPEPEVVHPDVPAEAHRPGSPVGWLLAQQTLVVVRDGGKPLVVRLAPGLSVPLNGAKTISLDTGVETLTLGLVNRKADGDWERMGRDRYGLWAEIDVKGAKAEATQRFRWIAPGRFMMGSPDDEEGRRPDEGPQHEVTLTRGYWMADTPVTQALYLAVMGENPSRFTMPPDLLRPVEQVSWDDSSSFVEQLGQVRRAKGDVAAGLDFRMPTEAEWEHACRAGTTDRTYTPTDARLKDIAWFGNKARRMTQPVASLLPNSWGLFDTLGNVWEWCLDSIALRADYGQWRRPDPMALSGPRRVNRGGSWRTSEVLVRAATRDPDDPSDRQPHTGVRLVRGPPMLVGIRLVEVVET